MTTRRRTLVELRAQLVYLDPAHPNTLPHEPGPGRTLFGVWFECPACDTGHRIGVAWADNPHFPRKWSVIHPTDLHHLTLVPSIDATVSRSCLFHGWIREGVVTW